MRIKLKVFLLMSLPVFLMIFVQFSAFWITYKYSLRLIFEFNDNLYIDQQNQIKDLLSAYSFEFCKVFQSFSQNLQIMNNFEAKILRGEVNLQLGFIKPKGNEEKLYQGKETPLLQALARKANILVSTWANSRTMDESQLVPASFLEINLTSYSEVLPRAIRIENNFFLYPRNMTLKDIYEGYESDGMISGTKFQYLTKTTYKPPAGCPYVYTGPIKYDCRCRNWFFEPINRAQLTPIEPILFYTVDKSPFLASNLCKRQQKYILDSSGNLQPTKCGYSVNCLNFPLSTLQQFFDSANYKKSKTIMIDPRSKIVLYNSISGFSGNVTYLKDAAKDLFPLQSDMQKVFVDEVSKNMKRVSDPLQTQYKLNDEKDCTFNSTKTAKLLGFNKTDYQSYSQFVDQINEADPEYVKVANNAKSFILKTNEGEEVFVALNAIVIIDKIQIANNTTNTANNSKNSINKSLIELQDLYLMIDVLPKTFLTTWTDKLTRQIYEYLLYFGIGSIALCVLFLLATGLISYKVGVMIEVPLIHMIKFLNRLEKEGGAAALAVIEEITNLQDDTFFLSYDLTTLFESFVCIFRMVHLATQDIFTVSDSFSLLQLNYQINFFKQFRNRRVLGICYNNIGNIHFQNGRYLEAMENYMNAIVFAYYEAGLYDENDSENHQNQVIGVIVEKIDEQDEMNECAEKEEEESESQNKQQLNKSGNNDMGLSSPLKVKKTKIFGSNSNKQESTLKKIVEKKSLESILEVIFDRRLNFSQALFMYNITQELAQTNPGNQYTKGITKTCSSTVDWEEYETVLLELIEINNQFTTNTAYGRSVVLFSQLSLCQIKMGKVEEAIIQQGQAIENYELALILEDIRKKSAKHSTEGYLFQNNRSQKDTFYIQNSQNTKPNHELLGQQGDDSTLIFSPMAFLAASDIDDFNNSHKMASLSDEISLFSCFRQRQASMKPKQDLISSQIISFQDFERSQQQFGSNQLEMILSRHSLRNPISLINNLRTTKVSEYESPLAQKTNQELNPQTQTQKYKHLTVDNRWKSPSLAKDFLKKQLRHYSEEIKRSQTGEGENEKQQQSLLTEESKTKQASPKKNMIVSCCINPKGGSNKDISTDFHRQNDNLTTNKQPAVLASSSKPISMKQDIPKQLTKDSILSKKTLFQQKDPQDQTPIILLSSIENQRKSINISQPALFGSFNQYLDLAESNKGQMLSNEINSNSLAQKSGGRASVSNSLAQKSNTRASFLQQSLKNNRKQQLQSKINKNLQKEDCEKISRYELPCDILLYYVGLQEAKILISEQNDWQASLVLTGILEKTKFYLPYYRLACLRILDDILKKHSLHSSATDKMASRFDGNITFRVQSIIAVNSAYSEAAKTCLLLVNQVLVKEEDQFALLVVSNHSFQQVLPSLSIKQLNATGTFFQSLIQTISGDMNSSISISSFSDFSKFILKSRQQIPGNLNQTSMKNISMCHPDTNVLQKTSTQDLKLTSHPQIQHNSQPSQNKICNPPNNPSNLSGNQEKCVSFGVTFRQRNVLQDSPRQIMSNSTNKLISNENYNNIGRSHHQQNFHKTHYKRLQIDASLDSNFYGGQISPENSQRNPLDSPATVIHDNLIHPGQSENETDKNWLISSQLNPFSASNSQSYMLSPGIRSREATPDKKKKLRIDIDDENSQLDGNFRLTRKEHIEIVPATKSEKTIQPNTAQIVGSISIQPNKLIQYTKNDSQNLEKGDWIPRNLSSFADQNNTLNPLKIPLNNIANDLPFCDSEESSSKPSEDLNSCNNFPINIGHFPDGEGMDSIKVEVEKSALMNQSRKSELDKSQRNSVSSSVSIEHNSFPTENINLVLHMAVRKAILNYFQKDPDLLAQQKRLTEKKLLTPSKKFIVFITDQAGITENNSAYSLLSKLLYETQIQLLVLQLDLDENIKEKTEIADRYFNNKSVIKYFYTQDKLLQYIRNKREPMKNFGIPLLVEHFSV